MKNTVRAFLFYPDINTRVSKYNKTKLIDLFLKIATFPQNIYNSLFLYVISARTPSCNLLQDAIRCESDDGSMWAWEQNPQQDDPEAYVPNGNIVIPGGVHSTCFNIIRIYDNGLTI